MKLTIEIPKEVKQVFDNAESNNLKDGFYDYGGIIGRAIQNGIPLDDVKEPKNGERFSCPNCGFKADWFIPSKENNTKESK